MLSDDNEEDPGEDDGDDESGDHVMVGGALLFVAGVDGTPIYGHDGAVVVDHGQILDALLVDLDGRPKGVQLKT